MAQGRMMDEKRKRKPESDNGKGEKHEGTWREGDRKGSIGMTE